MFITAAYAADAAGGTADIFTQMLPPMIAVLAIMYFVGIRPQQKRQKEVRDMLSALRRGDTVVTAGGIVGKVTKVLNDSEVQVEVADGVRVRLLKGAVTEVRTRGEPVKDVKGESEDAEESAEADDGAPSPEAGDGTAAGDNVKQLPTNNNRSAARPQYQKSKGRRR